MNSFYQIIRNKIIFSDHRFDQFRAPIIEIFEQLERVYNSKLSEEVIQKIIKKRKDCSHKITAIRYALALIQGEISQKMSAEDVRSYSMMIRNKMCDEAELKNEVLIYETESFLFQVKSSLDVLVQLLKNIPGYESLEVDPIVDRESFDIDRKHPQKSTPEKIREAGDIGLADYLDDEISTWIRGLNRMRNEITHRSSLEGFTCFVYISDTEKLIDSRMPNGEKVDDYCKNIYSKLLDMHKHIIINFIIPKL